MIQKPYSLFKDDMDKTNIAIYCESQYIAILIHSL